MLCVAPYQKHCVSLRLVFDPVWPLKPLLYPKEIISKYIWSHSMVLCALLNTNGGYRVHSYWTYSLICFCFSISLLTIFIYFALELYTVQTTRWCCTHLQHCTSCLSGSSGELVVTSQMALIPPPDEWQHSQLGAFFFAHCNNSIATLLSSLSNTRKRNQQSLLFSRKLLHYHCLHIFQKFSWHVSVRARRVTRPNETFARVPCSEETAERSW